MGDRAAVSACLLSYKRPQHMQRIVDSLHTYPFIDEILVWNNNCDVQLQLHGDKVRVIQSTENMGCYGRFLCAREARNDVIYVQDDDAIVRNMPQIYETFLSDCTRIAHALSPDHFANRDRTVYGECHLALLGWGAFFKKEWLSALDAYVAVDGESSLFKREADKFFSLLLKRHHNTIVADLGLLDTHATPGVALYLEHDANLKVALSVRRCLAFLRESRSVGYPIAWNVVIPCRNYGRFLRDAVHSVLLNDADYTITIVDDASSDDTEVIGRALALEFPWITYLRHECNVGTGRARNSGVAARDSIFTVLLDADDMIGPNYLFEAERLLRTGCDVANPDAILFGDVRSRWPVPETVALPLLLERNLVHCSAAFRRGYWAQVGGVDEEMDGWEDYEFWIRLVAAGARVRRVPGDHFSYRRHGPSRSGTAAQIEEQLRASIRHKHAHLLSQCC
jgi:GT2 family glycosyltransferase